MYLQFRTWTSQYGLESHWSAARIWIPPFAWSKITDRVCVLCFLYCRVTWDSVLQLLYSIQLQTKRYMHSGSFSFPPEKTLILKLLCYHSIRFPELPLWIYPKPHLKGPWNTQKALSWAWLYLRAEAMGKDLPGILQTADHITFTFVPFFKVFIFVLFFFLRARP